MKKNLTSIALATLTANLLVGCVTGDNEMPDDQDPDQLVERVEFPKTCAEKAIGNPNLTDGAYTLYLANDKRHPWTAFCADLQSKSAKEYLSLENDQTYSRYAAGGQSPGTDVVTTFEKIRVDPISLKVDIADLTFAVSEGKVIHMGTTEITSMNLGIAMSCDINARGFAQLDLNGTPFGIANHFRVVQGSGHHGMWESGKVIELGASPDLGYCGWVAPTLLGYDAPITAANNWVVALTYL
ncbi:MAG: hypothetical protein ACKV2T_31485 [Kofleriaceae bacterium]